MKEKLLSLTSQIKISRLRELTAELSRRYRQGIEPYLETEEHHIAYLATRYPATFGAIQKVLNEIAHLRPESMLDLGAGPGTGWAAAKEIFPNLSRGVMVERDPIFIKLGKKLTEECAWKEKDLKGFTEFEKADLVLLSYSIGEIAEKHRGNILNLAWEAANLALIIIEPGTPAGFERIRAIRDQLINYGGKIIAPCPHEGKCPMTGSDWCHFAARVQRSSQHRLVKEGSLGFEDEKFSYIIVGKKESALPEARILRHPLKQKGHVVLTLCTKEGVKNKIVTRSDKSLYKNARKLSLGGKLIDNTVL